MAGLDPKELEGVRVQDVEAGDVFEIQRVIEPDVAADSMLEIEYEGGDSAYLHYLEANLNPRYQRADGSGERARAGHA